MKQIIVLAIAFVFSISASATDFGKLTGNWLQGGENTGTSNDVQRIGGGTSDPEVVLPVGDSLFFLVALAAGYIILRRRPGAPAELTDLD